MRTLLVACLAGCSEYDIAHPPVVDDLPLTLPTTPVAGEPWLAIDPEHHDFAMGCPATVTLTLANEGDSDLHVDALGYEGAPGLALEPVDDLPWTLAPGDERQVVVSADSSADGEGALVVTSDDPRGELRATQGMADEGVTVTEVWTVDGSAPIDIVFALDKSCSMDDEMSLLASAAEDFIATVDSATTDWHIGVVSHSDGCFNEGIILPSTPNYEAVFSNAIGGFQILGTGLSEALWQLTSVALKETTPGSCNDGFVREDAILAVVAVSDEPEQSGTDWSAWVSQFRAAKADDALVVLHSVVDFQRACGEGADGYTAASEETGGLVLDVCTSDWGAYAADLGLASVEGLRTFALASEPVVDSIEVRVDGVVYDSGWHYEAGTNEVVVDVALPGGAEVAISYALIGC